MIRVGFLHSPDGQGWMGGVNYYRNLFSALQELPSRRIEPVILAPDDDNAERFDVPFPTIRTVLAHPGGVPWKLRRASQALGRDVLFEALMRRHDIAVLSHSGHLGRLCPLPTLPWIPDFQELHLPQMFSSTERDKRAQIVADYSKNATRIMLSSEAAKADLWTLDPVAGNKATVVPFVSNVPPPSGIILRQELLAPYRVNGPYFHLPNQFWAHKNHGVVLDALRILADAGRETTVLATGAQHDRRHPGYFEELMSRARTLGVTEYFRPLGLVPYAELMSLMHHSIAVINPSLFEGWSTTVEEAKSMGKAIILSDIATHREQQPARAEFFSPNDASGLARAMLAAVAQYDSATESKARVAAFDELPMRRRAFAMRYENVVLDVAGSR